MIGHIVKKVVNSPETIGQIAEAIINNHGVLAWKATPIKSEHCKYTDSGANIEDRFWQNVEAWMKLNLVAAPNQSKIGAKLPTDNLDDVKTNRKA